MAKAARYESARNAFLLGRLLPQRAPWVRVNVYLSRVAKLEPDGAMPKPERARASQSEPERVRASQSEPE